MARITQEELNEIIRKHKMWIKDEDGGERAVLANMNLSGLDFSNAWIPKADMHGADLHEANFYNAVLYGADLSFVWAQKANFRYADLLNATIVHANMSWACLYYTNLRFADMRGSILYKADMRSSNLVRSDLSEGDLQYAEMFRADIRGAVFDNCKLSDAHDVPYIPMVCPEEGSFIGWKKAYGAHDEYIVKLLIPEDARRSSSTCRKCRCNKAKVLAIETLGGKAASITSVHSDYDSDFIYTVGETVEVPDFCEDRFQTCAPGIHFFVQRLEAVNY